METSELLGLGATPIIVGLVQILKPFISDERFYPVIAIAMGVAWNLAVAWQTGDNLGMAATVGVVVGLASAGLYDFGKTANRVVRGI